MTAAKKADENHQEAIMELTKELEKVNERILVFESEMKAEDANKNREIVLEESQRREYNRWRRWMDVDGYTWRQLLSIKKKLLVDVSNT